MLIRQNQIKQNKIFTAYCTLIPILPYSFIPIFSYFHSYTLSLLYTLILPFLKPHTHDSLVYSELHSLPCGDDLIESLLNIELLVS